MKIFLIKKSTMGGTELLDTAYISKDVAERKCKDLEQEFVDYKTLSGEGEEILKERVIVVDRVYKLNKETGKDDLKKRALSKLTGKEKAALGIK